MLIGYCNFLFNFLLYVELEDMQMCILRRFTTKNLPKKKKKEGKRA